MAIMPAASLRLLLFSLCGDAMGRCASAMKVRGAFDLVKKCRKPGCRNSAASARAKFCIGCFKDNARCTGFMSGGNSISRGPFLLGNRGGKAVIGNKGNRSAKGVIGNCGNRSAKGVMGNSGITNPGKKKKLAGKRSALRRSTKWVKL